MNILEILADSAKQRVRQAKKAVAPEQIKQLACAQPKGKFEFETALSSGGLSFICECKKASPSKGIIAQDFPYLDIAMQYESAGADCISVLTEPTRFLGSDDHLEKIAANVSIPCLRKDFTVDEYMIYQAKLLGAKAVLLIVSILSPAQLESYLDLCSELGLSALVEAHTEDEVKAAVSSGARIIGVNNRNLADFSVDTDNSSRLRQLVPSDVLFVSESGVTQRSDVQKLESIGADAVLIGETLMRAPDIAAKLARLRGDG